MIDKQKAQWRREVLEEAAEICIAEHHDLIDHGMRIGFNAIMQCVEAIRRMAEQPESN